MATAIIIWVRRRPHAERCGRFRLSPGIIVPLHISTCEGPLLLYCSHLVSGPASGPEKRSPCRLIGMRGKTIRRGIHGSTSEHRNGLCAVVPVSHEYLGATASDTGSLGESVQ